MRDTHTRFCETAWTVRADFKTSFSLVLPILLHTSLQLQTNSPGVCILKGSHLPSLVPPLLSEMLLPLARLPRSQRPDSHGHSKIFCKCYLFGKFFPHHSNFCSIYHSFSPLNLITSCGHYLSLFYITCSLYQNMYPFKVRSLLHSYSPDVS